MTVRPLRIGLLVALLVAGGAGILWLRRENEGLRRRTHDVRRQQERIVQLREENERTRKLAAVMATSGAGADVALQAELKRLRIEVAVLERRGDRQQARAQEDFAVLMANRDPETDYVLVEYFRNVGRTTPSATFQTLVWAAEKGDARTLAGLLALDDSARVQLERTRANLPESVRNQYPTPEDLAALYFSDLVTGHMAARVLGQDTADPQHASVTVAFERMTAGLPLGVRLTNDGWQIAVTNEMVAAYLSQARRNANPKAGK